MNHPVETPIEELLRGSAMADGWETVSERGEGVLLEVRHHGDLHDRAADLIESLRADVARFKEDHGQACKTIADMHAAALGEVCGPVRGVVEDVADLRESFEKKSAEAYRAKVRAEAERERDRFKAGEFNE